ncbi:MAG: BACON domain-containing protein [Prevotella sp.]|nr:BACON domain-containing protein [Prevotella sp.]
MPIIIKNTNYNGEVLSRIFTLAVLGCQIVEKGLICVIPNVDKKLSLPRLRTGKMLQKNKEMPSLADAKGNFEYSENELDPEEFMAFTTFNPNTLYNIWRPFQPKGDLVFTELPPSAQNALLDALSRQVKFELGWHYINGTFGKTDDELFNGILYRIKQDRDVIRISSSETTMIKKLYALKAAIPEPIKEHPNLRILMSPSDFEEYDAELTSREHKNSDETKINEKSFKGIKIETLVGWPSGLLIATLCAPDEASNLFAGVHLPDDENVIQIDKYMNAGELYFFKMKMKADTNIAFGEEVVVLDTRENPEFAPGISLSLNSKTFDAAGGTQEITVTATSSYKIGAVPAGFSVKEDDGKFTVTAAANTGSADVTGSIEVSLANNPAVKKTLSLTTLKQEQIPEG